MSQIIIVSNRLPISVKREEDGLHFYPSLGGLATGLSSYVGDKHNIWIGWPGIASDDLTDDERQEIVERLAKNNCVPVFLTERQIRDFYNGYSNTVLWPLFHSLPTQNRDADRHKRWWQAYRNVNHQFAEAVLNFGALGSHVWVHDYQLLLVPSLIRAERPKASIGFFLHIPFPSAKSFSRLPEAARLLHGMLGADLVGFHTPGYIHNFEASSAAQNQGIAVDHQIKLTRRTVQVASLPMGIDYKKYALAGRTKVVQAAARRYRRKYRGLKRIVAVDRMDPSKGLRRRLRAYRELLERHPKYRGKVVFSMVAAPSRTDIPAYKNLSKDLDSIVAEINSKFGTPKWQPVDYMNIAQPFEEVAALFQIADVAFIAPLRDGMNLAAKEFVASNRGKGVLILSETAGAAEELREGALLVNPRQQESMVAALEQALTMSRRELRRRLKYMRRILSINTVNNWAKTFLDTLQKPVPGTTRQRTQTLNSRHETKLMTDYLQASKRLLLFDYDGTLVPFREDFAKAKPPESVIKTLNKLASEPRNDVVLISGRSSSDLQKWFGNLPIGMVAEHGATYKLKTQKKWQTVERAEADWQYIIKPQLEKYAELTPKAHVETKPHSLVWHYRASPPYYAQKYVTIIKRTLKPILKTYDLVLYQGNKILEIKNPRINKGVAVERWVRAAYDYILAIGDDYTDEQLFEALRESAYTIKVGRGRSNARFRVSDSHAVLELLKNLNLS
ncbi:MAG TPA: bifunctional alpha,alpha-trehalose-phosphate synthase (UDP-forming)/trehalose-phosphatase [Candidatus Saccharimonadales bacterium]|nr:bifunctional alpha,alpha-trehalose-phosphate synthase (UDP-forming)/trehalose-phosphatase [Candidatus Saccharimonadales bacterium]